MRLASMTTFGEASANTRKLIVDRQDFAVCNLSAGRPWVANRQSRMPYVWRAEYEQAVREGRVLYEVRSWQTPIAWYVEDEGWVFPPVGYTAYSSRHQGLVRRALHDAGITYRTTLLRHPFTINWKWEVAS